MRLLFYLLKTAADEASFDLVETDVTDLRVNDFGIKTSGELRVCRCANFYFWKRQRLFMLRMIRWRLNEAASSLHASNA